MTAGLLCLMVQEKPGDLIGNRWSPSQRRWREVWLSDRPVYSELYLEGSCLSWQSFRCPGGPVNTCIAGRVFNHLNHQGSPFYLTLRSQFRKRPGRWAGCAAAGQMGAAGLSQSPGHRAVCRAAFFPAPCPSLLLVSCSQPCFIFWRTLYPCSRTLYRGGFLWGIPALLLDFLITGKEVYSSFKT